MQYYLNEDAPAERIACASQKWYNDQCEAERREGRDCRCLGVFVQRIIALVRFNTHTVLIGKQVNDDVRCFAREKPAS